MSYIRILACLAVAVAAAMACGDDDDGPDTRANDNTNTNNGVQACVADFGMAQACGGDLEGTWTYVDACGDTGLEDGLTDLCTTATIDSQSVGGGSGSITVTGGSITQNVSATAEATVTVPSACLVVGPVTLDCATVQTQAQQTIEMDFPGVSVTCATSGPDCSCDLSLPFTTGGAGTIVTSNGVATVDGDTYYYCVNGDRLLYRQFGADGLIGPTFLLTR